MRSQYVYKENVRGQALTLAFNVKKCFFLKKNNEYWTKLNYFTVIL